MKRRKFLKNISNAAISAGVLGVIPSSINAGDSIPPNSAAADFQIGAYYFPNYHVDPRNEKVHGKGWTEWELVKRAEPRYPGHYQPRVPLWGYEDESKPSVFEKKIQAAAEHCINNFIFDWYWYDDGPFLERGLEKGYLNASNNALVKFSLMWANHDWFNIHPAKLSGSHELSYPGIVSGETFEQMTDYIIRRYFSHPSYWKINGCPYFSIYQLHTLIEGLGGIEKTNEALKRFRGKTRAAGFPDLHLNAVLFGVRILPGEEAIKEPERLLAKLNFDSITSYVWIHHVRMNNFPVTDYREVMRKSFEHWHTTSEKFDLPYYPNVTVGWDSSPRTCQSDMFANAGYPFTPVLENNPPEEFRKALCEVREFLESQKSKQKIFNINSWNEWTEGSYLEPDKKYGPGYLEAVRDVFKK